MRSNITPAMAIDVPIWAMLAPRMVPLRKTVRSSIGSGVRRSCQIKVSSARTAPTAEPTTIAPPPATSAATPTTETTAAIKIPALKGRSLTEAQSALSSVGLSYRLKYKSVSDAAPDTVIDSDPLEGQEVPPDTRVTLVIAAQPQSTPPSTLSTVVPGN